MRRLFLPAYYSLEKVEEVLSVAEEVDDVIVADTFAEFIKQIDPSQDEVVVDSLDCFASMIDMLDQVRGLRVLSLGEPWFTNPAIDKVAYLEHLYNLAIKIHRARTQRGLSNARNQGKTLGRTKGKLGKARITAGEVARVEELRRTERLSLAAACRAVGCSLSSYNTYHRNLSAEKNRSNQP